MKRFFYLAFVIVCSVSVLYPLRSSKAAGSELVKSGESSAVYYVFEGKRFAFPNERIFFSWYPNFDSVSMISNQALADIQLQGSVQYRPGVQLVKLTTDPKVYAVSRGGLLRWIQTETLAIQLYGQDWSKKVHDLSDAFFPAYIVGEPITTSGQYNPSQETNSVTSIGQNLTTPSVAQSQFFKGSALFANVLQGTPMDLTTLHVRPTNVTDKTGFAYKLLAAFLMLGYSPNASYNVDTAHLRMLQQFQKQNGLPVTAQMTAETAKKLDMLLAARETALESSAQSFPLYGHMGPLAPSEVSRDYIATLYSLPMLQLPQSLQLHGEQEFVDCIKGQCVGFLQPEGTAPVPYWNEPIDISKPYLFTAAYFDPQREAGLPGIQNSASVMHTVLHEYAHYIDGSVVGMNTGRTQVVDTKGFYDIVHGIGTCDQNKDALSVNFLTRYGLLKATENCEQRPDKSLNAAEDFADSLGGYVMWGRPFRSAAAKNNSLFKKYQWLKDHVFQGKEFETEFPGLSNSGCVDDAAPAPTGTGQYDFPYNKPGYLSCSEDFVWDGTIKGCQGACRP